MRKGRGWAKGTGRERGKGLRARTAQEQEGEQGVEDGEQKGGAARGCRYGSRGLKDMEHKGFCRRHFVQNDSIK